MLVYSRESCRMRARSQEGSRSRFDVIQEIIVDFRASVAKMLHISLSFSKISLYRMPTRTEWNLSLLQGLKNDLWLFQ